MEKLKLISEALQKGKAKDVKEMVQQALDAGLSPQDILNDGLLSGMNEVGIKFKNNEVYVPDVLIAARAMKAGTEILKPLLVAGGVKAKGRVVIGTVKGDLHDIGKNLVAMMMEGQGLEIIDAGTDVSADQFIALAKENNAQIIACSALLTTTMGEMKAVVEAASAAGIRDQVTIMVGGAPVNDTFAKTIGADIYSPDAATAAEEAAAALKARGIA
ncbi:MAG: cobalamin-binding protein [Clostridiaceae bacterium]|jgi:corrinoid protein of di/trimethylamine methyltransferase|nr:corrinoid protein [Eubacteriales bacterium]NLV48222.1 cobalamin-binding protein [Clostridiaceae bacterium]